MLATLVVPTSLASRAATVLIDCASAVSRVIGPRYLFSKFLGCQSPIWIGSSTTGSLGLRPASMAVR